MPNRVFSPLPEPIPAPGGARRAFAFAGRLGALAKATALALALLLAVPAARAAPCAGFSDVDAASAFCPNVEWIRNRGITLGCTGALYCPGDAVSRLAMAAFMNRLGTALTPLHFPSNDTPGALDLDLGPVVCQTPAYAITGFPRRAHVDASFSGQALASLGLAADVVISKDGGANWSNLNAHANRGAIAANQWGALADVGYADLSVGESVRFGIRASRGGLPGNADLADSRCSLRVLLFSRTGAASPL